MTSNTKPCRATGKWRTPGVPHTGWTCDRIEDSERRSSTCEMCEVTEIRFIHYMQHPDYPEELRCGCVCAGHMEGNPAAARGRENALKRTNRRVEAWTQAAWKTSTKGNSYLIVKHRYILTVFRLKQRWGASITYKQSRQTYFLQQSFTTHSDATHAVLSFLARLMEHVENTPQQEGGLG